MKKFKVVLTDNIFPDLELEKRMLSEANAELVEVENPDNLADAVVEADAVINTYMLLPAEIINKMQKCKLIIRNGIGVNTIDIEAASKKGIMVANIPTYCLDEVSTHTVALLLACNRKIAYLNNEVKSANWNVKLAIPIYSLQDKILGLLGFGKISQLVSRKIKAFGMKVITYDPYITQKVADEYGVTVVDFETLLKDSDYLSIHCPLTDETRGLLNYSAFKMMKKTAYVINTARGPIINEKDLITALKEGEIAGAGLDVLQTDGVDPDNPLLKMDNVIITPHSAWYSEESIIRRRTQTIENVIKVLQGGEPDSFINKNDYTLNSALFIKLTVTDAK